MNRFTLTERICVSIGAKTIKELSSSINKALELSDFLEIRFDYGPPAITIGTGHLLTTDRKESKSPV